MFYFYEDVVYINWSQEVINNYNFINSIRMQIGCLILEGEFDENSGVNILKYILYIYGIWKENLLL